MKSVVKKSFWVTWVITSMMAFTSTTYAQFNRNVKTVDSADTLPYQKPEKVAQRYSSPEFPGGIGKLFTYLSRKMKFPKDAQTEKVNGEVRVKFVIDTLGNVRKESVRITQSLFESCDREAIRLIQNNPRWIPAIDLTSGKKIEVWYEMPIMFRSKSKD